MYMFSMCDVILPLVYKVGGMTRGLHFGILLSPLGGCKGQDEQNPKGGVPGNGVNVVVGVSNCQSPCYVPGCHFIAQSSVQDRTFQRSAEDAASAGALFSR